jgi:hypothetical protein
MVGSSPAMTSKIYLMVRSDAKHRVSNHEASSFETRSFERSSG